jgi:putative inorganic carbon (hco3(-)) transporter
LPVNTLAVTETCPPRLERAYILLCALLPFSIDFPVGSWSLDVPSEPLLAGIGLYLGWLFLQQPGLVWRVFRSQIWLVCSFGWLLWMGITVCFSSMPMVSLKYWVVDAGHWWVLALGFSCWPQLLRRALPWYLFSMVFVAVFSMMQHSQYQFRVDQALLAPMPFFYNHTMYGAVLAMSVVWMLSPDLYWPISRRWRWCLAGVLVLALALSASRAAAASLVLAGMVSIFYRINQPRRWWLGGALLVVGGLVYQVGGGVLAQKRASDVSYQERLNRWDCAASMLAARGWVGYGPGTFAFQYQPFQRPEKRTRISLDAAPTQRGPDTYGRGGGAHSEYWQAAAETGWPGLLLWLALVLVLLRAGFLRIFGRIQPQVYLPATLALVTFFSHAVVNNFLHDGRIALLVWASAAWLATRLSPQRFNDVPPMV